MFVIPTRQAEPNRALPGYYHVSAAGPYRSTLQMRKRDGLSARQRRKQAKALRRSVARRRTYSGRDANLRGRTALVRPSGRHDVDTVLIQLDFDKTKPDEGASQDPRCFGWYEFPAQDWA